MQDWPALIKREIMKRSDWIVINYKVSPPVQECFRCGETAPMPFYVNLTYAADVMKAFVKYHRKCRAKR